MYIRVISTDCNNFAVEIKDIGLNYEQCYNFINRIKGKLREMYDRKSMIFKFYDVSTAAFKIKIPIDYYKDFEKLKENIKDIYDSMVE